MPLESKVDLLDSPLKLDRRIIMLSKDWISKSDNYFKNLKEGQLPMLTNFELKAFATIFTMSRWYIIER